jgi:predicted nucleotidyltransferase
MDVLDDEIMNLWHLLQRHKVQYILVGGFATNLHGFSRMTADIDLWIKDTRENRKNLRVALKEMELGDFEGIETMQFIPGWSSIVLNSGIELDLMSSLKGFSEKDFDACYKGAALAEIGSATIRFISLNDLIKEKAQAAREKDKLDLIELEKIKKASEK